MMWIRNGGASAPAAAPSLLRSMNQRFILDWLYQNGPATRPQISRAVGLSQPTVFATLANLEDVGLVRTRGQSEESNGRPALIYEVDPGAGTIAAVDVGRDWLRVMVSDLVGTILARAEVRNTARSSKSLVGMVKEAIASASGEAGIEYTAITHTIIASPGVYQEQDSRVIYAAQLPEWQRPRLYEELRDTLGMPVTIENDVNLAALGEHGEGAGRGVNPFVYLHIGTGIGIGIVIDGKVYTGATGAAGEIGFLPFAGPEPLTDTVDREHGILEAAFAADSVVEYARRLGLEGATTAVKVFELARKGVAPAKKAVQRQTEILAALLTSISAFLDPELIVVGGGIGQNLDLLGVGLADRLNQLSPLRPRIVASVLGVDVAVRGAVTRGVAVAREAIFAERMARIPGA
ncbi:sugar kinase [Rugosimonospora africana]|uniref:Sugar kinase n=2 Tax=Rugosimonospora africana TaxID=556532 RepID=A0A8J3QX65_9ACTN|nr:sugar kinase [Rugosimonospora africana]